MEVQAGELQVEMGEGAKQIRAVIQYTVTGVDLSEGFISESPVDSDEWWVTWWEHFDHQADKIKRLIEHQVQGMSLTGNEHLSESTLFDAEVFVFPDESVEGLKNARVGIELTAYYELPLVQLEGGLNMVKESVLKLF